MNDTKPKNLFASSVKVKETVKKTVEKKIIKAPELGDKVKQWGQLKAEIDAATAELKMLEGDIKTVGRTLFIDQYRTQKSTPENFVILDDAGGRAMFILMDKYTCVDEGKAAILGQFDNLLNEKVEYKFNPELVDKYGGVLSDLISNSPNIDEEDKGNLISGEKSFSVVKGSIDRLLLYPQPEMIFELINPIVALKK